VISHRILAADQKQQRVNVCKELHQITSDDATFLSTFITDDESWIYSYNPETMQHSSQWKSPPPQKNNKTRPKKAGQVKSKVKSMLIIFFGIKGIVHNSADYCDTLRQLHTNVRRLGAKLN
jgi:hypothetical protein